MSQLSEEPSEKTTLLHKKSADISRGQIAVIVAALFIKGGLFGAYVPFSSLWLSIKGYRARDLGILSLMDAFGCLLLPIVGICADKCRAHNTALVSMLVVLCILKLSYIPAASSFLAIILLTAATAPLLRASNSILDALALYAFPDKADFSRVRLFGDLGFGCVALGVGFAMDVSKTEDSIFYIFACMCGALACMWCIASPYMTSIRRDTEQMSFSEFRQQLSLLAKKFGSCGTLRALFMLYVLGSGLGLIGTFEFVLLKGMMGSGVLLGLCKAWGTCVSIPVWWWVIKFMDSVGFKNAQLFNLACLGVRLGILSIIDKPWQALLSESFAGFGGFAMAYSTVTVFSGRIVPEDMKGTVQTLLFVVFLGLGAGGSPLLGSVIVEWWGIQRLFACMAVLVAFVFAAFLLYDLLDYYVWGTYCSLEEICKPDDARLECKASESEADRLAPESQA